MIRTVITLLAHDLTVAFKNKTIWLIVGIPCFVYATLSLVDPKGSPAPGANSALLQTASYAPAARDALQAGGAGLQSIKRQSLPTWILMMALLVGFMVLPAQVAEEKEKQLLLGWMQTPVRESEWLVAKLVYGIVLTLASVVVLQSMGGESSCACGAAYLAMVCLGGFCFGSLGILLGLLCRQQASARTLGILCYLPLLLPAALSDQSAAMRRMAPFVPSFQFYEPIRVLLLEGKGPAAFMGSWISLAAIGALACCASHRLLRTRWLM